MQTTPTAPEGAKLNTGRDGFPARTFTPGPYKAAQGSEDDPLRWIVVADNETKPWTIATIENGQPGDTCETEKYTALLMAAAPELLAALKDMVRDGETSLGIDDPEQVYAEIPRASFADWIESARAAIAKAEGGPTA